MKKLFAVVTVFLLACSLPLSAAAADKQRFPDVPPSKHFAEAVNELAARNIIGGYPDGTFKPGNSITRGQAAAIIAKMIKLDTTSVKIPGFTDVSSSHGFYKAIAAMAEKGIIGGYPDGSYKPNEPINRKNMASILVKAFDLPRDAATNHPFKDPSGITNDVLIIYKLGITTGTTPTTFSPNAFITRGQAAKMLKATEEVDTKHVVTLDAEDFGWNKLEASHADTLNTDVFTAVLVKGKEGYTKDKIQLIPLKEGKGSLIVSGVTSKEFAPIEYIKYYVHVEEVNGELKLSLKETDDFLPTVVKIWSFEKEIQNISLSTMDSKKLSDSVVLLPCGIYETCFEIDKAGQYIVTIRYKEGDEVRYGVEAKAMNDSFYYTIRTLPEKTSAVYDKNEKFDIGQHKIVTKNHDQIATVTRDPGTNTFRATGKKEGYVEMEFEHITNQGTICDGIGGYCQTDHVTGLTVSVEQLGSIMYVSMFSKVLPDH